MHSQNSRPPRQLSLRTAACCLSLAGGCLISLQPVMAGESAVRLAEQEIQRRAGAVLTQEAKLSEADGLLRKGETAAALKIFEEAYNSLPDVPLAQEMRVLARDGYVRAGLVRSRELMDAGNYPAAAALLDKLDGSDVAKGDRRIIGMRERMNDPDRYPPALTPEHIERVGKVKVLLMLGQSQTEIGEYDKALRTYEEVLRLDKYNSAARLGMQRAEKERSQYFENARDHNRSQMLNVINGAWEQQVPSRSADVSRLFGGAGTAGIATGIRGGREAIQQKLRDLKLARIDFSGASLAEVVEYLRVRSRDLDPEGRGIDFVLSLPPEFSSPPISLSLTEMPLEEVLRYVTEIAGLAYRVEDYAVRLVTRASGSSVIISKTYKVPPDFISKAPVGAEGEAPADPFGGSNAATGNSGFGLRRMGAQEYLESYGITFGEGAGASYSAVTSMLIVRNTASNLELVDTLVEQSLMRSPKQVVIDVRLLEVGDNRLTELGFDWLLGGGRVSNGQYELGGGTAGNAGTSYLSEDFPFQGPTTAVGANPITAGLRSSADLGVQGVDSVLYGAAPTTSSRSPGVLSVAGVLTNPQFQGVIRALDQKKGVDLAAQPSVITRSGQQATLEITRELIYPTEFDPPQIPTNVGAPRLDPDTGEEIPGGLAPAVVTPSTPTAFEMRRTGVVLNVTPEIAEDGRSVDVTLNPEFTEFVGFVNYGSPINTVTDRFFYELTPNLIFQPIFDKKQIVTSVKVWDGATVVLGGLITDREELIDDKVPVLGDMPFIGRMFKSEVKQRRVRHMVMFVTVRVVDPSGARINPEQ